MQVNNLFVFLDMNARASPASAAPQPHHINVLAGGRIGRNSNSLFVLTPPCSPARWRSTIAALLYWRRVGVAACELTLSLAFGHYWRWRNGIAHGMCHVAAQCKDIVFILFIISMRTHRGSNAATQMSAKANQKAGFAMAFCAMSTGLSGTPQDGCTIQLYTSENTKNTINEPMSDATTGHVCAQTMIMYTEKRIELTKLCSSIATCSWLRTQIAAITRKPNVHKSVSLS